jgi:crossover junction endodeoxyribonuclease RuvC
VLGVDPGNRVTGWGVVERADAGRLVLVAAGTVRTSGDDPVPVRLRAIHEGVAEVIRARAPEAVVVEEAFAGVNARSAIRLGEARAVCILAAAIAERPVHELSPALVKRLVAGHGQAGKEAVRSAVLRALGVPSLDPPPALDAADALALALAAITRLDVPPALRPDASVGRRGRRRGWTLADIERLRGS